MSTSFQSPRISLPPTPSQFAATSKFSPLTEEQSEKIESHKTCALAWRALFPSDTRDGDDALRGLANYCAKAVHHLFLPEETVTDCVSDVLAQFSGMTEQEAFAHEQQTSALRYISHRVKSRCIDHIRSTQTIKGKAEYSTESLSVPEYGPTEVQAGAETFADKALAVGTNAVRSASEVTQSVLGALLANKTRLCAELNCKKADEVWRIAVAILGSASCQKAFESGTERSLDAAVTAAIASNLGVAERNARLRKADAYAAIDRACLNGSHLWSQIRDSLRQEAGADMLVTTHAINRGRTKVTTKIVVSKPTPATKSRDNGYVSAANPTQGRK
jgi:hypothetical protein